MDLERTLLGISVRTTVGSIREEMEEPHAVSFQILKKDVATEQVDKPWAPISVALAVLSCFGFSSY
jgi:hypothetical protein